VVALGLVLLLASTGSFAIAAQAESAPVLRAAQGAGQGADGLTLFRPLMPVLTSPRCANCHGGTDPASGENHGGGVVAASDGPSAPCLECHTAETNVVRGVPRGPWEAVSGITFDDEIVPMCETMRHVVQVLGPSGLVSFLAADPVVGLGFDGLRGMDERSPFWPVEADPPPMNRADFVAAAARWATEGRAECGGHGWSGSIVQTTNLRSISPGSELSTDLTVTITVTSGQAMAHVHMVGSTIQDGATVSGCRTYNHETFAAEDNVPAQVEIAVTPPLATDAALAPGYELPPGIPDPRQGGYFITFIVPQLARGAHHIETQSVTLPPRSECQHMVQDPPYSYAARGGTIMKPLEAEQQAHLVGTDTVTEGGSTVTTTWDLRLE